MCLSFLKQMGQNAWFPGQIAVALMTACVLKRFGRHRTTGCGQGYLYAVWKTWPRQFWGGQCVEFCDCVTRVICLTKLKLKKGGGVLFFLKEKSSLLEATCSAGCSIPNRETLFQNINKQAQKAVWGRDPGSLASGKALPPPLWKLNAVRDTRVL